VKRVKLLTHDVEDFDRWRTSVDRYSGPSRSWRDSDGYSESAEREPARGGRYGITDQFDTDYHGRYDHDHAVADLDDVRLDLGEWITDDLYDDSYGKLESVVYEEQLRRHGWRMEVPGDPLNIKYVVCTLL